MADDLRSTLEAAVAEAETAANTEATAPAPAPSPAPAPAPAEKPTLDAATGKEVTDQEGSGAKVPDDAGKTPPEVTETDVEGQEKEPPAPKGIDKAPQSWKPTEKAKWAALDPGVRAEIVRRERETTSALQEASGAKKFAQGFEKAVQPYIGRYRELNLPPTKVIENLMQVDHALATGPASQRAEIMAKMITEYQIDVEMLAAALDGERPTANDPLVRVQQLLAKELAPVQQFIQGQAERDAEANRRDFEKNVQAVERMEQDPKYPLFALVREDMADVIEINLRRGVALTADEAYNRAVRMNPEAAAEAAKMTKQSQAQKLNEAAQRSLGASLSVTGSNSSVRTEVPANDLRGTIEAAVAAAAGR